MTSDDIAAEPNSPQKLPEPVSLPSPPARSLRPLARLISSRTTDLLAIAVVLIGGLTLGRQMLTWWHEDVPAVLNMGPLENLGTEWGANSQPVAMEFGGSQIQLIRQQFDAGGPRVALDAVRNRCQEFLVNAAQPASPADPSELEQLESLRTLTPDIEQPGRWQLFTLGGGLVVVVGVKTFDGQTGNVDRASPSSTRRVICWGLVFPGLLRGMWTAYTFVRRQGDSSQPSTADSAGFELARIGLPDGCQRTVLMQEAGQTGLLGFRGRLDPAAWQRHFDGRLQTRGWKQVVPWEQQSGGWSSRFVSREAGRDNESTIQIQFHLQNTDQGVGLIHWLPGRESSPVAPQPTSRGTP
ncbi:MAG: hypothetical protein JWN70_5719 [Planctomycetaceae bacterium]|nr:hypothetical protein [Planctomycetaceae bacterium]